MPAIAEEASGPSYSVTRLCSGLIAQGHEVELAALEWAPIANAPPFLRQFPIGSGPRRLGRSPAMFSWLSEQGRSEKVSIIHNHSLWMMPNIYPGWVARRFEIPLVISPRGTLSTFAFNNGSAVKRLVWPLLQKPAIDPVTCFHATAISEYEDIRRMGFRQPVAVIPNGVDIPPMGQKAPKLRRSVLFLGRIHKKKGLDMLLPAWRVLQDRFTDWDLKIAGPDNRGYLGEMRLLAEHLRLKRIEFLGPVYGEAKWQMYRDSDLFVLPTYSENFGMSIAESLAAGTPAIVSKGAPWGGLEDYGAGQWIDIGIDPLVASLESLMTCSTEDLDDMGRRGRAWMSKSFSWQTIGHQILDTYRWIQDGQRVEAKPAWISLN